jgi:hypothetical protein
VPLIAVEGRRLILGACDLVDGTPVFDLKPYIPAYDSFPDEKAGWLDEMEASLAAPPQFRVEFSSLAQEQAEWLLQHWAIDFRPRVNELLSRDPSLHRTRRITRRAPDEFVIGCGAWRAVFKIAGKIVFILSLEPGYPRRFLEDPARTEGLPDRTAQLAYMAQWPSRLSAILPRAAP